MAFELIQNPSLSTDRKAANDEFAFYAAIPPDADGRIAHECTKADCSPGYFKVKPGTGLIGQTQTYCPYCREEARSGELATQEQKHRAKEPLMRKAKHEIHRSAWNGLRIGSSGKKRLYHYFTAFDSGAKLSVQEDTCRPFEESLRRDVICPKCTLVHSVYGLATWCPDCGKDIFTTHVLGAINVIEFMVVDVDRRLKELGRRVAAHDLENALDNLVSMFETAMKIDLRRYLKGKGHNLEQIDAAMKKIGGRSQSVTDAVVMISSLCGGTSLLAPDSAQERKLDRVFQKRHPANRNPGVADRKLLETKRTGVRGGQAVRIEKGEILEAAQIAFELLSEFHARLFPSPFSIRLA